MISAHASTRPRLPRFVCTAALFALAVLPGCDALTDPGAAGDVAGLFAPPPDAETDPAADSSEDHRRLDDAAAAAREPEAFGADPNPNCTIAIEELGTWANTIGGFKRPGPGNTKQFRATVMPANSMVKIRFSLVQTSREKGTTLNAGNTTDPDLTFENQAGYVNPTGDKQQIIEDNANDNTATVVVTAHDYGAFGFIAAEIVEGGCTPKTSPRLSVIKDANTNHIEDEWDNSYSGTGVSQAANADNESFPTLGNVNGDWLSRYEEYRGFIAEGSYVSTDPTTKTWFWADLSNIEGTNPGATSDMNGCVFDCVQMIKIESIEVLSVNARNEDSAAPAVINANRTSHSVHRQQAAPMTNSTNTNGNWGRCYSGNTPDSCHWCRVNVPKFERTIRTAAAVNATQNYIPVRANTNGGDEAISWHVGGRISVEDEVIDYGGHQFKEARTTLFAPVTNNATALLVNPVTGQIVADGGFGILEDGNNTEQFTFTDAFLIAAVSTSTLTAAINDNVTTFGVANAGEFNFGTLAGAWVVIDAEQMKLTAVNTTNNTITVTRGQNGTTAAAHANGATVSLPPSFYNVTRGQYGTTAAAHAAGTTTLTPRCFYNCTRGAAGTTAAAHAANRIVPYFYSPEQTNAAIASTLAHEASHTLIPGDGHLGEDAMFIMKSNQKPGAWDEHGVYHTHSNVSLNVMRFRLP